MTIAARLKVTKPSVHTMIKALSRMGCTTKGKYEAVHLTALGRQIALRYSEYFRPLCEEMAGTLKLPQPDCANAVCAVLAETRENELAAMAQRLQSSACRDCPCRRGEEP
ncbi:MAG: hypothetical protein VB092_09070 [Oscillospiraceae bacterium]|nr:hypothetical protein [Oscillospiraceae bacterium]